MYKINGIVFTWSSVFTNDETMKEDINESSTGAIFDFLTEESYLFILNDGII